MAVTVVLRGGGVSAVYVDGEQADFDEVDFDFFLSTDMDTLTGYREVIEDLPESPARTSMLAEIDQEIEWQTEARA